MRASFTRARVNGTGGQTVEGNVDSLKLSNESSSSNLCHLSFTASLVVTSDKRQAATKLTRHLSSIRLEAEARENQNMPELPEVENFRRLLLPLVSKTSTLSLECTSTSPPKKFLSPEDLDVLNKNCRVKSVERKGKLICMVLECIKKVRNQKCKWSIEPVDHSQRGAAPPCFTFSLDYFSLVRCRRLSIFAYGHDR